MLRMWTPRDESRDIDKTMYSHTIITSTLTCPVLVDVTYDCNVLKRQLPTIYCRDEGETASETRIPGC
jgi:hypothetical protein